MCRLAAYIGPEIFISSLVTEPKHSIIHQSYHSNEREEPLNGDGFGIAWYAPQFCNKPAIFKDVTPAWNNQNLIDVARVTKSSCIFAHVRAATVGGQVSRGNCHPFSWKNFSFMHNGTVLGFDKIQRNLRKTLSDETYSLIKGHTDSEHIFALFAENMLKADDEKDSTILKSLICAIQKIESLKKQSGVKEPSTMNLVVTDGVSLVATRYASPGEKNNSLYFFKGQSLEEVINEKQCLKKENPALLIASEPLGNKSDWEEVNENHVLINNIHEGMKLFPICF